MDFDLIDPEPLLPNWGRRWQGGTADMPGLAMIPGPVLCVCMNLGEFDESLIDHSTVWGVFALSIEDDPAACLPDDELVKSAKAGLGWLLLGGNLYVHCAAGISRSSYMDIAMHCIAIPGTSADAALAHIRVCRPQANPNPGFLAQLRRLWP